MQNFISSSYCVNKKKQQKTEKLSNNAESNTVDCRCYDIE